MVSVLNLEGRAYEQQRSQFVMVKEERTSLTETQSPRRHILQHRGRWDRRPRGRLEDRRRIGPCYGNDTSTFRPRRPECSPSV